MLFAEMTLRFVVAAIPGTTAHIVHLVHTAEGSNIAIGDSHMMNGFEDTPNGFVLLARNGLSVPQISILLREYYRFRPLGRVILEASPQMLVFHPYQKDFKEFFGFNARFPTPYVFEAGISRQLVEVKDPVTLWRKWEKAVLNGPVKTEGGLKDDSELEDPAIVRWTTERIAYQRPKWEERAQTLLSGYRELLSRLTEAGATVCMLRTPLRRDYLDGVANDEAFSKANAAFRKLASEYSVRYVDFEQLPMAFTVEKFVNADHLNHAGSSEFAPLAVSSCFDN